MKITYLRLFWYFLDERDVSKQKSNGGILDKTLDNW